MGRPLRQFRGKYVQEITTRTLSGLYRLAPKPELVQEIIGIFGEAQRRYPGVAVHYIVTMSNHFHGLSTADDANVMGAWSSWVFAAIARAAQFHHGFKGQVWARRYRPIAILDAAKVRARVKYLMAQGCDANQVRTPREWPGVNCVDAVCRGAQLKGTYVTAHERRTALRETGTLPLNRTLTLVALPGLPEKLQARQTWFRQIEKEIIEETRVRLAEHAVRLPTIAQLRDVPSTTRPDGFESSPAPACHATCRALRKAFVAARAAFVAAWREALDDFRRGVRVCFPDGGWWPFGCRDVAAPQRL
jgi:hypothetical protein